VTPAFLGVEKGAPKLLAAPELLASRV